MDLKPILQNRWLIVLGVIGILCLLFGTFWNGATKAALSTMAPGNGSPSGGNQTTQNASLSASNWSGSNPTAAYEGMYDKQLTAILENIQGIHAVSVMVTVDSTVQQQLATNEQDTTQSQNGSQGTSRSTTTDKQIFTQQSGVPYVVSSTAPTVRGVLVTVNADDFFIAKSEIIDAIRNVLDVPAYKISVEPQKDNP